MLQPLAVTPHPGGLGWLCRIRPNICQGPGPRDDAPCHGLPHPHGCAPIPQWLCHCHPVTARLRQHRGLLGPGITVGAFLAPCTPTRDPTAPGLHMPLYAHDPSMSLQPQGCSSCIVCMWPHTFWLSLQATEINQTTASKQIKQPPRTPGDLGKFGRF